MNNKLFKLGLLGEQISASLSPKIYHASAHILKLQCSYGLFSPGKEQLKNFLHTFWENGGNGLSITAPYKEAVGEILTGKKGISFNVLYRGNAFWEGASTDAEGFFSSLDFYGKQFKNFTKIVFLGNGGAVLALHEYLSLSNWEGEEWIFRRTSSRDCLFQTRNNKSVFFGNFNAEDLKYVIEDSNILVVQGTSAPKYGDDLSRLAEAFLNFKGTFVDMAYGTPSSIYHDLKKNDLCVLDGLPMLIEQAKLAQKYWWGKCPSYQELYELIQ